MTYIYRLIDPRDNVTRYIGQTKNIKQRRQGHISGSTSPVNKKDAWINELRALNLDPIMEIIEEISGNNSEGIREGYWIYTYLDQGAPLLNHLNSIKVSIRKRFGQMERKPQ